MCVDVVSRLLGLTLDEDKSEETLQGLLVLGALVTDDPLAGRVTIQVTQEKAMAWAADLELCLASGQCEASESGKLAGRLSFAVTLASDKVGRAFIGPLYAQQHDPLPRGAISMGWRRASEWWLHYLRLRPAA